jgi:hypothetical protein
MEFFTRVLDSNRLEDYFLLTIDCFLCYNNDEERIQGINCGSRRNFGRVLDLANDAQTIRLVPSGFD